MRGRFYIFREIQTPEELTIMSMMILKTSDCEKPTAKNICVFLADYAARLLASGATCIRLDKNVQRIAGIYNMDAVMTVMPRHIHLTVIDECSGEILTSMASVPDTGISFEINTELSRLSWAMADRRVDFREAVERYNAVVDGNKQNKWLVILLVSLANASFCRLFGGDAVAMAIVGIATLVGYYMKLTLLSNKVDVRLVFIICSFISSVIGATDLLFTLGTTPEIAIGTSVLYLVPGIPFLNSFSDLLYRRYLCAFARFADAVVLTCSLSIGFFIGISLMNVSIF